MRPTTNFEADLPHPRTSSARWPAPLRFDVSVVGTLQHRRYNQSMTWEHTGIILFTPVMSSFSCSTLLPAQHSTFAPYHHDPRQEKMPPAECVVCLEPKAASDFPTAPLTNTCDHVPCTCLDCVRTAITIDLSGKMWSRIACPECEELLSYEAIQLYADDGARQRYNDMSIRQALEGVEGFVWVCHYDHET